MRPVKRLLWWILASSVGGLNRARILKELLIAPRNANELATILNIDYKTTRHHLEVLKKNRLITTIGEGYGKMYFPSDLLRDNIPIFNEIWEKLSKKR
jgi:predicted transcriptional regulator